MPLVPALGRQRQEDLCVFKARLICILSSRPAKAGSKKLKKGKDRLFLGIQITVLN